MNKLYKMSKIKVIGETIWKNRGQIIDICKKNGPKIAKAGMEVGKSLFKKIK
ncbi:MAG: hypothetical protein RR515_02765 [Clostridium sp.]